MTQRLKGKITVVTGAASGIGLGVARRFVAEGARVYGLDRTSIHDPQVIGIISDITDETSVADAFADILARESHVDAVVANAGVQLFGADATISELELNVWLRTIETNLTGTFLTLKHAVRAMAPTGGSIIATGSPTGLTGIGASFTAYSASKAGIHGLVRVAAAEGARLGIRVNTVVPGFTATPLVSSITADPQLTADLLRHVPLGRPGRVEDVTGAMVYLASDESQYATGSLFFIDGGMSAL